MSATTASTGTIQALRLHAKKDIRVDQIASLPCNSDEVRVQIAYCGVCGSDLHEYLSDPIFTPAPGTKNKWTGVELPIPLGHEMSGTVTEVGNDVSGVQVGQKVAINPALDDRHYGAELCSSCKTGKINICKRFATYGLSAPSGGFSTEVVVKRYNILPLPDNVPLKVGALAEPLAVAWHAIRLSGFQKGQNALVLGAGPIGLAILLLLRVWEAGKVIVTEVTDARKAQAAKFGADLVVNPLQKILDGAEGDELDPVINAVRSSTEDGVDVAFDATGLQSTLDTALKATRPGGTIFNVAIHEKPLQLNLNDIACFEKKLLGGICYTYEDFEAVIKAMSSGKIPFEQMITAVVPLSNAVDGGFEELVRNKAKHVKILIQPDPAS
ncbi:GroES-like protein [Rhizodiscina lignyota]|uniref:GroES-like protein n=1 Tax=Rhizodiscina lignyota TaxID=1504668 RepID=A0A9P4IBB0_9PEZI|nr:GroES-like protein [Rhizodiscina lignyota]